MTSGGPYCFIAGRLTTAIFIQFLNLLKDKPLVKLVCPISKFENEVQLTNFGFENTPRLQYECKKNIDLVPYYENSSEYDLVAVKDKNIFASCSWAPLLISFYSDCEEYIKNGVALILYDKKMNCVASEAHGVIAEGMIEIGTVTHENYRGKKLSTIVCNQLIRDSIKKGLHPIWTSPRAGIR